GAMPYPYPVMGGFGGNQNGFGGDGWWIILLLLLVGAGGWGNGNGGYFGGNGLGNDFPWLLNGQNGINNNVSDGFRTAQLSDGITSIRDGIGNLSTQLCGCCSDMQMALANGFAGVEQGANTRQIANMQQAFAAQTAMAQGFNQLGSQFADCCCENRLATAQTQNIIAREISESRFADVNNTRDIIQSQTSGTQAILDKLCQLELDAKNDRINELERQLTAANLNASQIAQTAQIVDQTYNRLSTCPVGTVPVYGETPIFRCNNNGCGCGCNGGNF
ncbi:MAG: hypothetical protein J6S60_05680, partial [Oscillospiraceae bacterium]|nr:hypothetical protein [Oscillospiraceae bacterium]